MLRNWMGLTDETDRGFKGMTPQAVYSNMDRFEVMHNWNSEMDRLYEANVGRHTRAKYDTPNDKLYNIWRRRGPTRREGYQDYLDGIRREFQHWDQSVHFWTNKKDEEAVLQLKYTDALQRIKKEHAKLEFRPVYNDPMWNRTKDWLNIHYKRESMRLLRERLLE
jgi:hypothetical protein